MQDDSTTADDMQSRAYRQAKVMRHLYEMELHTTMQLTNRVGVMKVVGGWIYFNSMSPTDGWACFVPEDR